MKKMAKFGRNTMMYTVLRNVVLDELHYLLETKQK